MRSHPVPFAATACSPILVRGSKAAVLETELCAVAEDEYRWLGDDHTFEGRSLLTNLQAMPASWGRCQDRTYKPLDKEEGRPITNG